MSPSSTLLNWNASNIVAREDANLNKAPDKKKAGDKIDDMCALLMAVGRTIAEEVPEPEYKVFFV